MKKTTPFSGVLIFIYEICELLKWHIRVISYYVGIIQHCIVLHLCSILYSALYRM